MKITTRTRVKWAIVLFATTFGATAAYAVYNSYSEAVSAARTKYAAKNYIQARQDLEQAVTLAKAPAEKSAALLRIGQTYSDQGQDTKAREAWNKVLQMPNVPIADRLLAQFGIAGSYINEKKFEQGRKEFDRLISDKNADEATKVSAQYARAASYLFEKNYEQARQGFAVVVQNEKADPNVRANAQIQIGQTWYHAKNYSKAREEWTKVLSIAGVAPSITLNVRLSLADTYVQEKNAAAAEGQFAWARATSLQLAQQAAEQKNFAQARVYLQQALNSGKTDLMLAAALHQKVGETYLAERNFASARQEFASVLAMSTANLSAEDRGKLQIVKDATQISLGQSYRLEGNNNQARTELLKVTQKAGVDPSVKALAQAQLALLPN